MRIFLPTFDIIDIFSIFNANWVKCQKCHKSDTQIRVLAILPYLEAKFDKSYFILFCSLVIGEYAEEISAQLCHKYARYCVLSKKHKSGLLAFILPRNKLN